MAQVQALVPQIPAMMTIGMKPPQLNAQVEEFLMHNPVEPHAAARLRALPYEYQQLVLARGSLMGARDPTAVVLGRIRGATQGTLQYSRDVMMWSPAMQQQMQTPAGMMQGMPGMQMPGMPMSGVQMTGTGLTGVQQPPGAQMQMPGAQQTQAFHAPASQPPPAAAPVPEPEPRARREEARGSERDRGEQASERLSGRAAREDAERGGSSRRTTTTLFDEPSSKDDGPGSKKSGGWMLDWRRSRPQVGEEAAVEETPEGEKNEEGHMEVRILLNKVGLSEYLPKFIEAGVGSLKAVREMPEADLLEKCGMTEEHVQQLQQDLKGVGEKPPPADVPEPAASRTAPEEVPAQVPEPARADPPQQPPPPKHFEKARPPEHFEKARPQGVVGGPALPEQPPPQLAGVPAAQVPPLAAAQIALPKLVRPPRPKEQGASAAQVAHLEAAAAAAEAVAAAQARRGEELEAHLRQEAGGAAAPDQLPIRMNLLPFSGPAPEAQPQGSGTVPPGCPPEVPQGPGPLGSSEQAPDHASLAPGKSKAAGAAPQQPTSWEPSGGPPPVLRPMPLGAGTEPGGCEAAALTPPGTPGASDALLRPPIPKFSVADMLVMSGMKPMPKAPPGEGGAAADGGPAEGGEAEADAALPPGLAPPPLLDPGALVDPSLLMSLPPGLPPLPGMPPLPPGLLPPGALPPGLLPPGVLPPGALPPGALPPGTEPGAEPGLPPLPQMPPLPPMDPALEQQLQLQQEAASQQAYQFWVQQQLNAQMALFENERSLSTNRQPDRGGDTKPGPKKPSTQARLPGDWSCPGCGDHQFARNRTCRSCGSMRPADTY